MNILTLIIWAIILVGATLFFAKWVAQLFHPYERVAIGLFALIMLLVFLQVTGVFDFRSLHVFNTPLHDTFYPLI